MTDVVSSLAMLAVVLAVYLVPWIVAKYRGHANSLAIFWLNALLGWLVVGWVAALIWALIAQKKGA
jgi:hypothetical protein